MMWDKVILIWWYMLRFYFIWCSVSLHSLLLLPPVPVPSVLSMLFFIFPLLSIFLSISLSTYLFFLLFLFLLFYLYHFLSFLFLSIILSISLLTYHTHSLPLSPFQNTVKTRKKESSYFFVKTDRQRKKTDSIQSHNVDDFILKTSISGYLSSYLYIPLYWCYICN